MPKRKLSGVMTQNEQIDSLQAASDLRDAALSGDIKLVISPTVTTRGATEEAWTRDVSISAQTDAGDVHDWLNAAYPTKLAIANTSAAGTASIESTTLTLVNGEAVVEISGDAEAWLAGVKQEKAISVTQGAVTDSGNITVTVTAGGMSESPKAVVVAVVDQDSINDVAEKIRVALAADEDVGAFFTVGGEAAQILLTAVTPAANDGTMEIAVVDTDTTGVTVGASSDEAAGVAPETNTLTVSDIVVLGYTVTGGTSVETIVAGE